MDPVHEITVTQLAAALERWEGEQLAQWERDAQADAWPGRSADPARFADQADWLLATIRGRPLGEPA